MVNRLYSPTRSVLSLALKTAGVAMGALAPTFAGAQVSIDTPVGPQTWTTGDLNVGSAGTVAGTNVSALQSSGAPGALTNTGTIVNTGTGGAGVANTGNTGSISNAGGGLISGVDAGIDNATGSRIGSLYNAAGSTITGISASVSNEGTIGTLTNNGMMAVTLVNGLPAGTNGLEGITNIGGTIGTLINGGTIAGGVYNSGIYNGVLDGSGSIGRLDNSGVINGFGVFNVFARIQTLTNSGSIPVGVANTGGTIDDLSNTGTIDGNPAITTRFGGDIGTVTNTGLVHGDLIGVYVLASRIGVLDNRGTIDSDTGTGVLLAASGGLPGEIDTLNNAGLIAGPAYGVYDGASTLGTLTNTGTIRSSVSTGAGVAVDTGGSLGTLNNTGGGTITSNNLGVYVAAGAAIANLNNGAGSTISGGVAGIGSAGAIGTLVNNGLITGSQSALLLQSGATIGALTNAGTIAGDIVNTSAQDLTIDGGSGPVFGTLTGLNGAPGTITNVGSNVTFGAGNLLLNDTVDVGSGMVHNAGATLQVNNAVAIAGNYTQDVAATLQIGVGNPAVATGVSTADSGYGRLVVSGSATLAAGSAVTLQKLGGYVFAPGQRFVVLDAAAAGTSFNESALSYSINGVTAMVNGTAVTDGARSDLVLTVASLGVPPSGSAPRAVLAPTPAPAIQASVPNARSALTGLSHYSGISDAKLLNLYDAADALTFAGVAESNRAGQQLAPLSQAAIAHAASVPVMDVLDIVSARANGIRLAQNDAMGGLPDQPDNLSWAAWGQAFGGHASRDASDQVDGYSANFGGLLFGVDKAIADHWRAGGVFSYSNAAINNTGDTAGDSTRVNAYGLIGYASYTGKPWYANLSAGVVQQRYDTARTASFSGFDGEAGGAFSGTQYVARAEAGYPLTVAPATTLTPFSTVTYSYLHQNAYAETGGNGAALTVGAAHTTSVTSDFGVRIAHELATPVGVMVPDLSVAWRHEYVNDRTSTNARFVADPTGETAFTTLGASPVSNSAIVSAGLTLLRSNTLSVSARYEIQAGSGFLSQAGSLRLRQAF